MTFNPQIPSWGEDFSEKYINKLLSYHSWLSTTGIKTGLISPKNNQFIWDEFIVHSLYFYKIVNDLNTLSKNIFDLGTGGGIPGIPFGIVSDQEITLVDIKQKRIFELERLISAQKLSNITATKEDAEILIKNNDHTIFLMRCYIPQSSLMNLLEKNIENNKQNTFIVSSNADTVNNLEDMFHVKQEKFLINNDEYRYIDVITVK
jgi:16S rRNA G527 N7-methylase RsmG